MRVAVIDIGTNTVKLFIGEERDDHLNILESLKNVVDIGKNTFYRGRISREMINEVVVILQRYKEIIASYKVDQTKVIATTAVREAGNRDVFLDTVFRKTGLEIEVLNVGDVVYYIDSFLSYKLKRRYPIHEKNLLIAELGAGSLDISMMERGFTLMTIGLPIGTLRLKQFKSNFDVSHEQVITAMSEYVAKELANLKNVFPDTRVDDVILIDESYSSAIRKVIPDEKRDQSFFRFQAAEASRFLERVTGRNLDDTAYRYKISPDIADSIDGYAIVLHSLFRLTKSRRIFVLETSLSEALLANIIFGVEISRKYNKSNQLVSVARFLCRKYGTDLKHNRQVANISQQMFDLLREMLGLEQSDGLYLILAAYLHNIGLRINNRSYHKHTEYIINSLSLFRLTEEEIKIIACVARYHRKSAPLKRHLLYGSLPPDYQLRVQKLSAILRIANALDSSHCQKIKDLEISVDRKQNVIMTVYTNQTFVLERWAFQSSKTFFEEISGNEIRLKEKSI